MNDIYTDQGKKDPIAWARENGKTIEGKNPDVWLREQEAVTKLQKLARGFIARKDSKGLGLHWNKRIGCLLFLIYLHKARIVVPENNSLIAMALLIAESDPKQKDLIIQLITNLIGK